MVDYIADEEDSAGKSLMGSGVRDSSAPSECSAGQVAFSCYKAKLRSSSRANTSFSSDMSDSGGRHPDARVRAALPTELEDVARVLTRAFVNDPAMNWFGGVKELVGDLDNPGTASEQKTVRNQNWFQRAAVKATFLINGFVDVVVIPGSSGKEEIVAVAIWFPPGESLDLPPTTFVRAGMLKVIWGWGLTSTKVSAVCML